MYRCLERGRDPLQQRLGYPTSPPFLFRSLGPRKLPPALTHARTSVRRRRRGGRTVEAWLRVRRASEDRNARLGARVRSGRSSQVSGSRASASGRSAAGGPPSLPSLRGPFPRFGARPDGGEHPGWVPPRLRGRSQSVLSTRRRHPGLASPAGGRVAATGTAGGGTSPPPVETVARPAGRGRWRGGGVRAPLSCGHCCPSVGS